MVCLPRAVVDGDASKSKSHGPRADESSTTVSPTSRIGMPLTMRINQQFPHTKFTTLHQGSYHLFHLFSFLKLTSIYAAGVYYLRRPLPR